MLRGPHRAAERRDRDADAAPRRPLDSDPFVDSPLRQRLEAAHQIRSRDSSDAPPRAEQIGHVEDPDAADLDVVADQLGCPARQAPASASARRSHDVVGDEPVAARDELERASRSCRSRSARGAARRPRDLDEAPCACVAALGCHPPGDRSELRVFLLDGAEDLFAGLRLEQRLAEGGVAEEARDARQRLQVLAARVLRHDEQEEEVRRLAVDRIEVDARRGCARRSRPGGRGPASCRGESRRRRRSRCSGAPRARRSTSSRRLGVELRARPPRATLGQLGRARACASCSWTSRSRITGVLAPRMSMIFIALASRGEPGRRG